LPYPYLSPRSGAGTLTRPYCLGTLRWFVPIAIVGATSLEQLQENLGSVEVVLDKEILADLDAVRARYPNPAP
jgi:aryl-alcohol dehydrogenase-like predicted oxidoreductase